MKKKLTFTVGITTCYGDDSILDTVKSIRASRGVGKFRFVIIADRNPIKPHIKKILNDYGVELIENRIESGQIKKKKQILDLCKSDIIIYSQDDVLFEPYSISKILREFEENPRTTFVCIDNQPVKYNSLFEGIVTVGTKIAYKIGRYWNDGNNYLTVVARCEAFRTEYIKKNFRFIDSVVATDAFFYFENKKYRGGFKYLDNVKLYFKNPQTLREHLRKSSKFQHSREEMLRYFDSDLLDYSIPLAVITRALSEELIANPIKFILYVVVYIYSRLFKIDARKSLNPIWETDISTKKVIARQVK